ncbi:2OG-Fe(II) oxygenase family protein [Legionella shakespearei]|uniref:2-oxoglutarate-dependent ethylene/succinate-forming enzyme n=1 Tax=Legionella shakespearei DSM 23087 TaxID=1122169 RepID=A0A0W0YM06_9GAMM|nr:2OG-Fe(II) oxygenase family protein [Legionella shakespearei]KTD57619.1 oxidoreductase, 2OG-Fe(II) oxygenase family [Legionella shakespearei DSM 23087]
MSNYNFIELPIIDISRISDHATEQEEYKKIDEACRTYGAFFISGFNSLAKLDAAGLFAESSRFFDLDISIKNRYLASADNHFLGYRGIGSEFSELAHRQHEPCEQYKVGYLNDPQNNRSRIEEQSMHTHRSIFTTHLESCFHSFEHIGSCFLSAIARNLNLGKNYFKNYCTEPNHQLGLNCYPIHNQDDTMQYGMSAHKDLCLLTIIAQDQPGLMLNDVCGQWKVVPHIPGTLLIMLGEFIEHWTDKYYQAPLHQVLKSTTQRRLSIIYKMRPNYNAEIPVIEGINPLFTSTARAIIHTGKAYDDKLKNIMYIDKNQNAGIERAI